MRAFQLGAGFASTVILARMMGAEGFGAYAYAIGWTTLLAGFTNLGFSHSAVREVARARAAHDQHGIDSFTSTAYLTTVGASVLAVGAVIMLSDVLFAADPLLRDTARVAVLLVPLLSTVLLAQGLLRGHGTVLGAQAPEMILIPGLLLAACAYLALFAPSLLTPLTMVGVYAVSVIVAVAAGAYLLRASFPGRWRPDRKWIKVSLPFFVVLSSTAINAQFDVLMVGASEGSAATGVYAFATRLSAVPMIALTAISMPLSPMVAATFTKGRLGETQRLTTLSAIGGAVGTTAIAITLVLAAPLVTAAVGEEYTAGVGALAILCTGRVVEAWLGPGGTVLAMTRYAGLAGAAVATGAGVNVMLNLLLIGPFGIEGAALATAAGQSTKAFIMWTLARRRVGIRTSVFEAAFTFSRVGPAPP